MPAWTAPAWTIADPTAAGGGGAKGFRHGTHRSVAPVTTLRRIGGLAAAAGITRLGDVTGLDVIGIPVFQAVRPLARSISVSQGKGTSRHAARVSALMEAIELHCAERVPPSSYGPADPVERRAFAAMTSDAGAGAFEPDRGRAWCEGQDLLGNEALRVPNALVCMDLSALDHDDPLRPSSNGLASGNDLGEATVAALCEVIERDSYRRWLLRDPPGRDATRIDPLTVDDPLARRLLARIDRAGCGLRLWDMSDAHGVATVGCAVFERVARATVLPPVLGAGTHPAKEIALVRAITEAAQARATLIAGARDDLSPAAYADPDGARLRFLLQVGIDPCGGRDWRALPSRSHAGHVEDQAWLVARCRAAGVAAVARVDLSPPGAAIAVVKLVVPGFGDHGRPSATSPAA